MGFLILAGSILLSGGGEGEVARFKQDRFVIGSWVAPPLDERAEERYREMADAHFNLVIHGAHTPEEIARQLAICAQFDLQVLVSYPGEEQLDQIPDSPALGGFAVRDEPSARDFPALADTVRTLRAKWPGKLAYINLFPSYASPAALGTDTYAEHVSRFVEETGIDVLSMDYYPLFKPDADGRDGYCENLKVMRKYSLEAGIPFWNFFNIMPYGPHTDPTESQVRWQVFASLAHGAKGVMYFCYYTPGPGGEFPKGGAIITRDNRRTRHYYEARRLNAQLRNLGPTLMQLTSTGVYRIAPTDDPAEVLRGAPIVNLKRENPGWDPPLNLLVGAFEHADGRRAVMLMNYHFAYSAWPSVEFDAPLDQVREINKWTGEETPVYDDSPDLDELQISLADGEGRLFLLPPRTTTASP